MPVCAKKRQAEEIITPMVKLEKRAYQTKVYPAQERVLVMKSVLNALQDEGYIVYNVNPLLGFIYAVKDFDTADKNIDVKEEFGVTQSRMNYNGIKVATFEVNVNITGYGENIRLRTNFRRKLLNDYGNAQLIDDVDDAQFYSDFYEKVNRELDLQKQAANKAQQLNAQKTDADVEADDTSKSLQDDSANDEKSADGN